MPLEPDFLHAVDGLLSSWWGHEEVPIRDTDESGHDKLPGKYLRHKPLYALNMITHDSHDYTILCLTYDSG